MNGSEYERYIYDLDQFNEIYLKLDILDWIHNELYDFSLK